MMQSGTETREIIGTDGSTIIFVIREHDLDREWHTITKWLSQNIEKEKYRAGYMTAGQKNKFNIDPDLQAFFVQLAHAEDATLLRISV